MIAKRVLIVAVAISAACTRPDATRTENIQPSRIAFSDALPLIDDRAAILATPTLASVDSKDRLVVSDKSDKNVKIYDASGKRVSTVGRVGGGPGEFVSLVSAYSFRDSIVTFDFAQHRLSVFAPDGRYVRMRVINPSPFDVRVVDDSLLLQMKHPGQRGALITITSLDGEIVGKPFFERTFENEKLLYLTATFADGQDGRVFAALFGQDSIFAFDYKGRRVAAGPIDAVHPLPTMDDLLERHGGRAQGVGGTWFHHGMRALMRVVALKDGKAALFIANYDTKVGTDLLEGGELIIVGIDGHKIVELARQKTSSGLIGRDRSGQMIFMGYSDDSAERMTVQRALLQ
jgi:hypothetical protein